MTELVDDLLLLFERGGIVLWVILAMSVLMWALILDRYVHYFFVMPKRRTRLLQLWRRHPGNKRSSAPHVTAMMAAFGAPLHRFLSPIHTLANILPLLGLLGTINGMIKVFEVITVFGAGNARGMAAGISEALITTMAGLVTALSGLYFCVNLQSLTERANEHFAMSLNQDVHVKGDSK